MQAVCVRAMASEFQAYNQYTDSNSENFRPINTKHTLVATPTVR